MSKNVSFEKFRKEHYPVDDISTYACPVFTSFSDALNVLRNMNDIVSEYGFISVADLYDLCSISSDSPDFNNYGWTNIDGVEVVNSMGGYKLSLPKPEKK